MHHHHRHCHQCHHYITIMIVTIINNTIADDVTIGQYVNTGNKGRICTIKMNFWYRWLNYMKYIQ